jgi:hypothetical protein
MEKSNTFEKAAIRIVLLIMMAVGLYTINPLIRISYAQEQEKDTILSGSGIFYPGGYDKNTVGDIQGKIKGVVIPDSGPVRITLIVDKETYIVLASPGWFWKDINTAIPEGTEVSVRGSKSVGTDGNLYIIAQEIKLVGSKKILAFRSESGEPLWRGGAQAGRTGAQSGGFGSQSGGFGSSSGGFGSSTGGRTGGGSSGAGRGRR